MASPCTVAGMECTGSTYVFNLVRGMTGRRPVKTHNYVAPGPVIIVTYRDPRDILCSYARRQFKGITESAGIQAGLREAYERMFRTHKRHETLLRFRDDGVLLLKYESVSPRLPLFGFLSISDVQQFFGGNEGALYDTVRQHLIDNGSADTVLPDEDGSLRASVLSNCSLDSTKAKAAEMVGGFRQYDKESHIHGDHVSFGGKRGAWRQLDDEGTVATP